MGLRKTKLQNIGIWLTAIAIFISIPPVQIWSIGWIHTFLLLPVVFLGVSLNKSINPKSLVFFIILALLYAILVLRSGYSLFRWPIHLLICSYVLFETEYLSRAFDRFITIYSFLLVPSIFSYIIFFSGIITLPELGRVEGIASTNATEMIHYPFLLIKSSLQDGGFARFMAIYDEPGVVGTISAISAIILKFDFKDWRLYPNLIGGILSFSLAFFVAFAVGLLLFSNKKSNALLIVAIAIGVFYLIDISFPEVVDQLLFDRIQFTNGKMVGDDRTSKTFEIWYDQFKDSKEWWFGYGNNYSNIVNYGGASYKNLIVDFGFLFFFTYCSSFLVYSISRIRNRKGILSFFLIFFLVMYQRPFIETSFYFCMLVLPIYVLTNQRSSINLYKC